MTRRGKIPAHHLVAKKITITTKA